MSLDKASLTSNLLNLFNDMRVNESHANEIYFANQMATIIDIYVKTATVNTTVNGVLNGGGSAIGIGTLS